MRREPTCVGHGTATRAQTCGLEAALEAQWLAHWDAVNEMCVRRSSGRRKSVCVFACLRVCVFTCLRVCVFACLRVCMFACLRVCVFACLRVCVFACLRTSNRWRVRRLWNNPCGFRASAVEHPERLAGVPLARRYAVYAVRTAVSETCADVCQHMPGTHCL